MLARRTLDACVGQRDDDRRAAGVQAWQSRVRAVVVTRPRPSPLARPDPLGTIAFTTQTSSLGHVIDDRMTMRCSGRGRASKTFDDRPCGPRGERQQRTSHSSGARSTSRWARSAVAGTRASRTVRAAASGSTYGFSNRPSANSTRRMRRADSSIRASDSVALLHELDDELRRRVAAEPVDARLDRLLVALLDAERLDAPGHARRDRRVRVDHAPESELPAQQVGDDLAVVRRSRPPRRSGRRHRVVRHDHRRARLDRRLPREQVVVEVLARIDLVLAPGEVGVLAAARGAGAGEVLGGEGDAPWPERGPWNPRTRAAIRSAVSLASSPKVSRKRPQRGSVATSAVGW